MAGRTGRLVVLGAWSAASIASGAALWRAGSTPAVRSFGRETLGWGVVNAGRVALDIARPAPEPRRLRRSLLVECVADLGGLGLGVAAWRSGRTGAGAAMLAQGAFLLALDAHFAYHLDVADGSAGQGQGPLDTRT